MRTWTDIAARPRARTYRPLHGRLLRERLGSVRPAGVVVAQDLASNEGIRIAADHPVAGDDIVRLHGDAWTEPVVWVRLRIVGFGRRLVVPEVSRLLR